MHQFHHLSVIVKTSKPKILQKVAVTSSCLSALSKACNDPATFLPNLDLLIVRWELWGGWEESLQTEICISKPEFMAIMCKNRHHKHYWTSGLYQLHANCKFPLQLKENSIFTQTFITKCNIVPWGSGQNVPIPNCTCANLVKTYPFSNQHVPVYWSKYTQGKKG